MKKLFLFLLLLVSGALTAQTVLENNPSSLRWRQVNSPNFRVIFPVGFDHEAQRMANTLEHIRKVEANTLGTVPRKLSVILQNQSSVSNGFVSMFPRRSEFFTMPSQNYNFLGTNDWLNLLASHEYRHVVQYQHASRGFNKVLFYLFGSPTFAGMAHAAAPDWFWEGDAVATETAFTPGGRGRIPHFSLLFRTNLLEGRTFNYHKQYLRSYKHNIPNHYIFGYHMVSYLRRRTNDPDIWEKITARSWSVPVLPFAFSNAVKKESGMYVTKLYKEMARDLSNEWQQQIDTLNLTPFESLVERRTPAYTDYLYPQPRKDGSVLVMKEGIGEIERFVILKDGREEKVFTPGFMNDSGMLSADEGVVVWNEFGFDPRWRMRTYSRIKAYDQQLRKRINVSEKDSRFGSASLSPDRQFIATVRSDELYRHALVIISYPGGKVTKTFDNPDNDFLAMPRWSDDGKSIVALRTTKNGKTISVFDVASGSRRDILPVSNENTGHPVMYKQYVFFNAPAEGIDNIHVLDLDSGERFQVTISKYGAYNPAISADGSHIYYNDQTKNGMDAVRIPFDPATWKRWKKPIEARSFFQHLVDQEGRPDLFATIPSQEYPVSKYSHWRNVINPFSWGAFIENDLATVDVGISSRDILSRTNLLAGYTFDLNERTGFWRAGASYQAWFPIIDLTYTQGERSVNEGNATTVIVRGEDTTRVNRNMLFSWKEQNFSGGLRVPLLLTNSKYRMGLTIQNNVGLTRVKDFQNDYLSDRIFPTLIRNDTIFQGYRFLNYVGNGTLLYNYFSISGQRMLKTSRRDIVSRWGQAFNIRLYNTPFGGDFTGGLFSMTGYLYLPGLAKHHVLWGYASRQRILSTIDPREAGDVYFFRNSVPIPRGQSLSRFKTLYTSSVNYTFPLWYPDIAVGPLLNIQRFRANLFADYAFGNYSMFGGVNASYSTIGGELFVDFNVLRFLPQLDIGVRYSYGLSPAVRNVEVVIGTFNF